MTVALIDNSILSEYRTCNHVAVDAQKIEFLESILKKFQISIDYALVTDRLFVEAIGCGKVRRDIEKDNRDVFLKEKERLFNCLSKDKDEVEFAIINYIDFLEKLFHFELISRFPQNFICSMAFDNLRKFRFSSIFRSFNSKSIRYDCVCLRALSFMATSFLSCKDSVIRYALDGLNIGNISPKLHDQAFEVIGDITKKLMLKISSLGSAIYELESFWCLVKKSILRESRNTKNQCNLY